MGLPGSRRSFLAGTVSTATSALLMGVGGRDRPRSRSRATEDGGGTDAEWLLGAHYYPWYGPGRHWPEGSPRTPALGEYDSRSPAVLERHRSWAQRATVDWLSVSRWGPDSYAAGTLRETILPALAGSSVQVSVLYETLGRLQSDGERVRLSEQGNRDRLVADVRRLEAVFGNDQYLTIDGRPVLYLYAARALAGDLGHTVERMRAASDTGLYVIGDLMSLREPTVEDHRRLRCFDAVTGYNPLALWNADRVSGDPDAFLDQLSTLYLDWLAACRSHGTAFVPTVAPGFEHADSDLAVPPSPDRFERLCRLAGEFTGNPENAMLVTSFNEWHESTAIEPDTDDGTAYLDVLADVSETRPRSVLEEDYGRVRFAFDPVRTPDGADDRSLAFACDQLAFLDGDPIAQYDLGADPEPVFGRGAYAPECSDGRPFRWFGGPDGVLDCYVPSTVIDRTERLRAHGHALADDGTVTVTYDGQSVTASLSPSWSHHEWAFPG